MFLYLLHVKRVWQKQSCAKIKSPELCAIVLQELGSIMYDQKGPWGPHVERWAMQKIIDLTMKYPYAKEFWQYIEEQWLFKTHM